MTLKEAANMLAEHPVGLGAPALQDNQALIETQEKLATVLKELKHLVRLMEPLEKTGLNIPGLATLNGARKAIAAAEGRS